MEYSAEEMYSLIDHFNDIKDGEPNQDDVVTYYCDYGDECGFVENIKWAEGGLERLICRRWILQTTLDSLIDTVRKRKAFNGQA